MGDLGTMAVLADAGGAMIGMWQPGEHRGGVVAATNAPCHFELFTRDYDRSVQFYKDVFGWQPDTAATSPASATRVLPVADGEQAGIMDASDWLPEGVPAHWSVYFAVDDVDATLAKAKALGGATIVRRRGHPVRPPGHRGRQHRRHLQAPRRHHLTPGVTRARPSPRAYAPKRHEPWRGTS